jgi:hypothetical protein
MWAFLPDSVIIISIMTMTSPERTQEGGQFKSAVDRDELLSLLPEDETKAPLAEAVDYRDRAADIAETISRFQGTKGVRGAIETAKEAYVGEEEDPQMRRFSGVLCDARKARQLRERHEVIQAKSSLSDEERAESKKILGQLVNYEHAVKRMLLDSQGALDRQNVVDYLTRASGGDERWAGMLISGVAGEVAVYKALTEIDGIEVAWGTADEDKHKKTDIMVTVLADGRKIRVDAKFGGARVEDIRVIKDDLVEVGAAKTDLQDDFSLEETARHAIQDQFIRRVIR